MSTMLEFLAKPRHNAVDGVGFSVVAILCSHGHFLTGLVACLVFATASSVLDHFYRKASK